MIRSYEGTRPRLGARAYVDVSAQVIGDVELGDDASVWMNTVIRGDVNFIRVGARANVQDNCVLHQTGGLSETVVGADCTIGHSAILHGCRLHDRVLVGMGAIVMDNAEVASDCLVAAGSLLPPGKRYLEPGMLILSCTFGSGLSWASALYRW